MQVCALIIVRVHVAKSDFLAAISHNMKFSKDKVLQSCARISHKEDAFSPAIFFLNGRKLYLMTCNQSCLCPLFALKYTDSHSGSGLQSFICDREPSLGNIACDKTFLNKFS